MSGGGLTGLGSAEVYDVFESPADRTARTARELREKLQAELVAKEEAAAEVERVRLELKYKLEKEELLQRDRLEQHKDVLAQRRERRQQKKQSVKEAEQEAVRKKFSDLVEANVSEETDLIHDILWVYDRIDAASIRKAPSRGAASLWEYARGGTLNRKWFYQLMLPKALAAKAREEEKAEEKSTLDKDPGIETIRRMLDDLDKDDPDLEIKRLREELDSLRRKDCGEEPER